MLEAMSNNSLGELTTAIYAAIAGLLVGAIIKFFNSIADSGKSELDTHLALRKELREELDNVKEEIQRLQVELDEWKQKYYNQVEITGELKLAIVKLSDDLLEHKRAHQELLKTYNSEAE
jgi:DNA-binding protein YbaB